MTEQDLLSVLKELEKDNFEDFKWHLQKVDSLEGRPSIPKGKLEKAERRDTVDLMVQTYTLPEAVNVTNLLLMKINRNDLVQRITDSSSEPQAGKPKRQRKPRKKQLADKHEDPHETLDPVRLSSSSTIEGGGTSSGLVSASNQDLSINHLGDPGVKLLNTLRVEHGGEQRLQSGVRNWASDELEIHDMNTVNKSSKVSSYKRKATAMSSSNLPSTFGFISKLWRRY